MKLVMMMMITDVKLAKAAIITKIIMRAQSVSVCSDKSARMADHTAMSKITAK